MQVLFSISFWIFYAIFICHLCKVVFMECKTQFPLINKINALFLAANICSTNSTIRYWQNTALKGFFRDLYLNAMLVKIVAVKYLVMGG